MHYALFFIRTAHMFLEKQLHLWNRLRKDLGIVELRVGNGRRFCRQTTH